MRRLIALLLAAFALLAAAPAEARDTLVTPDSLTADEKARLQRGEPVLWSYRYDKVDGAQAMVVLPVPRQEAWALLTDYQTFADWMRSLEAITQVTWTTPTTAVVGYVLPAFGKKIQYALRRTHRAPEQQTWVADSGDLRGVWGGYDFYAVAPDRTLVRFWSAVDPGFWMPAFVKKHFSKQGLQELIEDIQNESKRRHEAAAPAAPQVVNPTP
jgi:hypothetical protein